MIKLQLSSLPFFASGYLLVGCLHVTGIPVLILAASVWKYLFLIVIFSISNINLWLFFLASCCVTCASVSRALQVFLSMVQVVFEFFLEQHFISVTDSFVFIEGFSLVGLRVQLGLSYCGSVGLLFARGWSIDFLVWLAKSLAVIGLSGKRDTLIRLISCLFNSMASLSFASRYEVLAVLIPGSLKLTE